MKPGLGDPPDERSLPVLAGQLAAGRSRLADLDHGVPHPEHVADTDLVLDGAGDGQVLGEGGGLQRPPEQVLPVRVVVERVDADGFVRATVVLQVGLPVAFETERNGARRLGTGFLAPAVQTTSRP